MIRTPVAGGPVIRHRRWLVPGHVLVSLALAACAGNDRETADTTTVPAIAVPVSDSAADSAARQAEEQPSVSPPARDTGGRPLIRPAPRDTTPARPVVQRPDSITIRLERTACLGGCPVYAVSLSGTGDVRWQGQEHVKQMGSARSTVPPAAVQSIVAAARAADFFELPGRYAYGEPTCPVYAADLPRSFITITAGGRTKRIEHDYGCENSPRALVALASRIDSVAGVDRWIGPRH